MTRVDVGIVRYMAATSHICLGLMMWTIHTQADALRSRGTTKRSNYLTLLSNSYFLDGPILT
jgi:hypothetical protein